MGDDLQALRGQSGEGRKAAERGRRRLRVRHGAEHGVRGWRERGGTQCGACRNRRPQGQKADLCGPAQGQQGQGRRRQDLRQSRPLPISDRLSARRGCVLHHLKRPQRFAIARGRGPPTAGRTGSMTGVSEPIGVLPAVVAEEQRDFSVRIRRNAEYVVIPLFALAASVVLFSLFLIAIGKSPLTFFALVERGGFGTAFSLQNTLQRSA